MKFREFLKFSPENNIYYVQSTVQNVLSKPKGANEAYDIDKSPWSNAPSNKKLVYVNYAGKNMTVEAVVHKFTTSGDGLAARRWQNRNKSQTVVSTKAL